jgi:hypothetical protein
LDHQGVLVERTAKFQVLFGDFVNTSGVGGGSVTSTGPGGGGTGGSGGSGGSN